MDSPKTSLGVLSIMYIIVRANDNVIVGSAVNPINVDEASKNNRIVYKIDDEDFNQSMIGQKLTDFEILE